MITEARLEDTIDILKYYDDRYDECLTDGSIVPCLTGGCKHSLLDAHIAPNKVPGT